MKSHGRWLTGIAVLLILPGLTEAQVPADADFDNSGRVDFADFLLFAGAFGEAQERFDLNHSNRVDFEDFLAFAAVFGSSVEEFVQFTSPDGTIHDMVLIPPGSFLMGSSDNQIQMAQNLYPQLPDELFNPDQPQHSVYLDAYYLDVFEVTNRGYANFLNAHVLGDKDEAGNLLINVEGDESVIRFIGGAYIIPEPEKAQFPVTYVSWFGAQRYCNWSFGRLPTEAEWEKAARGTDGRIFPWGNTAADSTIVNYDAMPGLPVSVGSYETGKGPFGNHDLAGNAYEWCLDNYDQN